MCHQKPKGISLSIRVVSTSLGNFFGHVSVDGIQHLAKSLRVPYWQAGTERIIVARDDAVIAEAETRFLNGDRLFVWTKGEDSCCVIAFMDADNFQIDDLLCIEPGPPAGKRTAPFFDRMCWNNMTGASSLSERPYIE